MGHDEKRREAMANWGSVARRGARNVTHERTEEDRALLPADRPKHIPRQRPPSDKPEPLPESVRRDVEKAVDRGRSRVNDKSPAARTRKDLRPRTTPALDKALKNAVGAKSARSAMRRIDDAATAYERERFKDAAKALKPLLDDASGVAEVRELAGLIAYRTADWSTAIEHLEIFRELTGSAEQHPVLADCHRALGHWDDVTELWRELGEQSPDAATVTEGRIVAAGALADRGRLADAVRLLEKGLKRPKQPGEHHLRRAYALADLYERSGTVPRARETFAWIRSKDPHFADVADRLSQLGDG